MEYCMTVWKYKGRKEEGTILSNWTKNGNVCYPQSINNQKYFAKRTTPNEIDLSLQLWKWNGEVYIIQFLFIVDQYPNQEWKNIFFVIQQCCLTHQYFFRLLEAKRRFYIHFTRNWIFITKKIRTMFFMWNYYKIPGLWDGNILFVKNVYRCIVGYTTYHLPIKDALPPFCKKNFRSFFYFHYGWSYL